MYQKDFILRMLEMLADLIAGMLGLIKKGDLDKASLMLENGFQDLLKRDAGFFKDLPIEDITETLLHKHNYSNGHLEVLGELFYIQAELEYAKEELGESRKSLQKSLILLKYVSEESDTFSLKTQEKLVQIQTRLDSLQD